MNFEIAHSYENAAAITPSDSQTLDASMNLSQTLAIYVGVSGDVKVDLVGGETGLVFKAAPVGILRIQATKVYATGTTATNLLALY